jgi:predicted AAA+ superfamily ATPase
MVFLGGPRRVGKTTLALDILGGNERHPAYFNYDNAEHRRRLLKEDWPTERMVVLDEIHKYRRWKGWLKGIYDTSKSERNFLVTGSARLDTYRKGGDSLLGRFHYYRLHPFSVAELEKQGASPKLERLLTCGGFPEPYLEGDPTEAARWRHERQTLVIRQDLRDLERVFDLTQLELLAERLPDLVGNPLSVNALAQDLEVSHPTIVRWLQILERLYYCYRIFPYGTDRIRAVKKEAKLYLWDWADVQNPGCRFENLVAGHLLKYCHFLEDTQGQTMELRYIRDTDKREVDFVVIQNRKPLFAVECKLSETAIPLAMFYFRQRTPIPKFYLVHGGTKHIVKSDTALESIGAIEFLRKLT